MIECYDLIKIYGDEESQIKIPALRGCDLSIGESEIVSIVGPSGAGKTTLINIIAGLESISSGLVKVAEYQLNEMTPDALRDYRLKVISLVDQFPERTLFLNCSVQDNLHFSFNLRHKSNPIAESNLITDIIGKLHIEHLLSREVKTLSGGEMTRVAIANALMKRPLLLLCDEPTGQLDSENTESVKQLLREISENFGTTVLVVTHDYRFHKGIAKTYEIRDGRLSVVTSNEEQERKSKFPLEFKSYIDSSKNMRIPDIIHSTLQLEKEVKLEVNEESEVKLLHPNDIPAKKITIEPPKKIRKFLVVKQLPEDYHNNKEIAFRLEGVQKKYSTKSNKVFALSSIDLTIHQGELVFIVGPSGSGKTTLIKIFTGLEEPSTGKITVLGQNYHDMTDDQKARFRRKNIGLVAQQGNLHSFLTVEENFYLKDIFSSFKDYSYKCEEINEFLKQFNIWHRRKDYPLEISGGELQRAALAVANYNEPPILTLDEPTANMDSELATQITNHLVSLHQRLGITLLIATHDISILTDGARAIELIDGRINRDGIITK